LGNPTTAPKARVSYVANYYDLADRLTDTANVGTNGGTAYTRPSSVPSHSDTVLVASNSYNSAGWVATTTDPRGIVNDLFYDNLGRTTKTIEAYTGASPSGTSDKTTEYTYDGSGHVLTVKAWLTGTTYETTRFVYGVSTSTSGVNSNDLLAEMDYPDKSTGDPSTSEKEVYTVNALGEPSTTQDRNGNVHTYSFDVVGRPTTDAVTTLGTGVDGAVRRLEVAYDTGGRPYLFTSYNASSGGTIVNQVQRAFNGLGQLTTEYQEHSGAVNTNTSLKVQYAYSEMAGGANHSRLVSMTYPDGRVLNYNYASGLDDTISRLTSLSSNSTTLEALSYLGLGTVVKRAHPEPGVDLTYIKQTGESNGDAGDQYTGLDRFGRVVDQRWLKTSSGSATDRFKYGYDRDSNRLYRDNAVNAAFGELYHANGASAGYDNLNQLTDFRRGTLSDTNGDGIPDTVTTASRSQDWTLDGQGNWSTLTSDGTGVNRTHNKQNEVTAVGSNTLTFDANGNMTTDETGRTLVYDAWNRLVQVKNSGGNTLASYKYNALGERVIEVHGTDQHDLYYSAAWQVVEERSSDGVHYSQYVWSPVYIDALVERDRQIVGLGNFDRLYVQQDANFNVTALLDTSGNVVERYIYDPYGQPIFLNATWSTLSGSAYVWQYLHQGGRYDVSAGLYSFRNRDYSPTLGRWAENDPLRLGAGDTNLYRYLGNGASSALDPTGTRLIIPQSGVTIQLGGGISATLQPLSQPVQLATFEANALGLPASLGPYVLNPNGEVTTTTGAPVTSTTPQTAPPASPNSAPPGYTQVPNVQGWSLTGNETITGSAIVPNSPLVALEQFWDDLVQGQWLNEEIRPHRRPPRDPDFGQPFAGVSPAWLGITGDRHPDWPWYQWWAHYALIGAQMPGNGTLVEVPYRGPRGVLSSRGPAGPSAPLPDFVPRGWSRTQIVEALEEVTQSIAERQRLTRMLGEHYGHTERIRREVAWREQLLRACQNRP
jgi:RHS repeat-associated protein